MTCNAKGLRQTFGPFVFVLLAWLGGCASFTTGPLTETESLELAALAATNPRHELSVTAFHRQTSGHCGPAALSMALADQGIDVAPGPVADLAYLPGRSGSLQLEMIGAARTLGAFVSPLPAQLDALLNAVIDGISPIVLLNLGLDWAPQWHYATVVGYDLKEQSITIRSGTRERETMSLRTFAHVWARAQRWGIVVHRPGVLSSTVAEHDVVQSAIAFERVRAGNDAFEVWQSITRRWPNNVLGWIGLGNQSHQTGRLARARNAFEQAIRIAPESAVAWNNLAVVTMQLGDLEAARQAVNRVNTDDPVLKVVARDTRAMLEKAFSGRPKSLRAVDRDLP